MIYEIKFETGDPVKVERCGIGAFGHVYKNVVEEKAYKIFLKRNEPVWGALEAEVAYLSEVQAYKFIANEDELRRFVPGFYGEKKIISMVGAKSGRGCDKYHLEYCFEMDHLTGRFIKLSPACESDEIKGIKKKVHYKWNIYW
jgi:hypothetical protein